MEKICVHTPTQEQWDIVLANSENLWGQLSSDWDCYKEDSHLCINNGCTRASTNYVRYNEYKILTFDEWVEKYKIKLEWVPKVGDWVVVTKGTSNWSREMNNYIGQCLQVERVEYVSEKIKYVDLVGNTWSWFKELNHFRKAMPNEIPIDTKWVPKVGDWVVVTKGIDLWDEEMNKYIGQCLQVRGGGEYLGYDYFHLVGNTWSWFKELNHFRKPYIYEIPTNKPVSLQGGESMVYESSITLNMGSDLIISKNKKNLVIPIKVEIKENQIRVPLIEKQPRSVFEIKTKY